MYFLSHLIYKHRYYECFIFFLLFGHSLFTFFVYSNTRKSFSYIEILSPSFFCKRRSGFPSRFFFFSVRAFHILKSSPPHFFVKEEAAFPAASSFFPKIYTLHIRQQTMGLLRNITFHKSPMVCYNKFPMINFLKF